MISEYDSLALLKIQTIIFEELLIF